MLRSRLMLVTPRLLSYRSAPKTENKYRSAIRPALTLAVESPRYDCKVSFSTQAATESSGGIRGWIEARNQRKQQEQYLEQMKRLSEMERLTLANYRGELERGLNQWGASISFLQTKEIKTAKEIVEVVKALIDVKGGEATADDLLNLDRLERLKVATASNKTVEEISILMSQIQNMDLMQRTLRKRQMEGKPIPPNPASMQAVIKKDALSVMTKPQKELMMKRQAMVAKRAMRKKR